MPLKPARLEAAGQVVEPSSKLLGVADPVDHGDVALRRLGAELPEGSLGFLLGVVGVLDDLTERVVGAVLGAQLQPELAVAALSQARRTDPKLTFTEPATASSSHRSRRF
ncbi:MAG: hypothetical protein ACR2MB_07505 [Acidimicrobiales bacterium]